MLFSERGYGEGMSLAFPVVRTSPFNAGDVSSIPDLGAMISFVSQPKKKKKNQQNTNNMVTNSIKPFKMAHILKKS